MKITSLQNDHGARVYHVQYEGCIHEFWTYKAAQSFVIYIETEELQKELVL